MIARRFSQVCFLVLLLLIVSLCTAGAVRHVLIGGSRFGEVQKEFILNFAQFPNLVWRVISEVAQTGEPLPLRIKVQDAERANWNELFPQPTDSGFLLLSGLNRDTKKSDVRLIRISDNKTMAQWSPDWPTISERTNTKDWYRSKQSTSSFIALHPLPLPGGDLVFNTGFSLVRVKSCSSNIDWVLDSMAHHSIEFGRNQKSFWVPGTVKNGYGGNRTFQDRLRDDSLMKVSLEGTILENISFSDILIENGLSALLFGSLSQVDQRDPIHMNQISEAPNSTLYWEAGDLLISARHLSSVILYRPSTRKIVWYKHGPWNRQHSAKFVGNSQISVFDNNIVDLDVGNFEFLGPSFVNRVFVFDFSTGDVVEPYVKMLEKMQPRSPTNGRSEILADGSLFFEETDRGRHFRVSENGLLWSRVNHYNEADVGRVGWSRYLAKIEGEKIIADLKRAGC